MRSNWRRAFAAVGLAAGLGGLGAAHGYSQEKQKDPKVVLDLEKPAAGHDLDEGAAGAAKGSHLVPPGSFGKSCSAFGKPKEGYRSLEGVASIAGLIGAPVAVVRVRRYGSGHDKVDREEVRKHVLNLLAEETSEEYRYEPWDEAVYVGLVAKIQFFDHSEGVLEESGNHVCFSDFNGQVWWTRIPPPSKPAAP
ncbi:MAG: hypothetical protein WA211_04380 [Candidatus Acidiferrales bacterium]